MCEKKTTTMNSCGLSVVRTTNLLYNVIVQWYSIGFGGYNTNFMQNTVNNQQREGLAVNDKINKIEVITFSMNCT